MRPRAPSKPGWLRRALSLAGITAVLTTTAVFSAEARHRPAKAAAVKFPPEVSGAQYLPVKWADIPGWATDDHLAAFKTFQDSCRPINAATPRPDESKVIGDTLRHPCTVARHRRVASEYAARHFFETYFQPVQISRLGEDDGFVTGYYEPIVDGSRTRTDVYNVPVYLRPSNLFVKGFSQTSSSLPNKGQVFRKIGRRKLVPYYDRGEIEDGAIAGRGLEICWLKNQTDLLFMQIQGSARVKLDDGSVIRLNYDAHNGFPYTPVGRVLIERNIIPREQMSMQRIRQWMEDNPDGAKDLRRQNRSYVFFREVNLSDKDEPLGAQGVPLTPGRSIAVDRFLHVYGTPFFISGQLPLESESAQTAFQRLMVAQDTGSAIIGPARADIYFGAGVEAGRVSGRLRHPARFVMLMPRSLDPVGRGRSMPTPVSRPSAKIAKLFPQTAARDDGKLPAGESAKDQGKAPAGSNPAPEDRRTDARQVPLPEARPAAASLPRKARR